VSDPRPGFQELDERRRWWHVTWWVPPFAILVGLLIFLGLWPDSRAHMLGRTEHVTALVTGVHTDQGCRRSRDRALYDLVWTDDSGAPHRSLFKRCGPVRYGAGDRLRVWVNPGSSWATVDGPREYWVAVLVIMPVLGVLVDKLTDLRHWVARRNRRRAARRLTR
jgi:hypothetical protein